MTKIEKIWSFMRWSRRFTLDELLVTTGCAQTHAKNFIGVLRKSGYVRVLAAERDHAGRRRNIYELVRDTGIKPPKLVSSLFDPNTGETFAFSSEAGKARFPGPKKGVRKCGSRF